MFTRLLIVALALCTSWSAGAQSIAVATNNPSNVTLTQATLNGNATAGNRAFTVSFEWGTTTSYGNLAAGNPNTVQTNATNSFSATLTTLVQNTTYHYRAVAKNSDTTIFGQDVAFTTQSQGPPVVSRSQKIYGPGDMFAFFIADVSSNNSATTIGFEYGTSTAYGQTGAPSPVSLAAGAYGSTTCSINGLRQFETYYYRWVFRNALGVSYAEGNFSTRPLAIGTVMGSEVHLYPNPTSDHLFIDFPESTTNPTIRITDLMGRAVPAPAMVIGQRYQLDLSALSNGSYVVRILANDHSYSQIITKK